jgi:peptidoglycan/LPS O-acetylase OafA/YrhL
MLLANRWGVSAASTRGEIVQAGEPRSSRVESLRAVAALGVLVFHAYGGYVVASNGDTLWRRLIGTGGLGVYLFFALTGYLLFWPFVRRGAGTASHAAIGRYVRNRILRIVPLYYFVLAVLLISEHGGGSANQWIRFLTFTQNFSRSTVNTVDGPMWSLGVEVEFYALLPILAAGLALIARKSQVRLVLWLCVLAGLSFAVQIAMVQLAHPPDLLWSLSLPATFFYFVSGMLLAVLRSRWEQHPPKALAGPAGRSDLWLLAAVVIWVPAAFSLRLGLVTVPIASFLAVGACVLPLRSGAGVRALEWRPLAILGTASYGIYLWNFPVIDRLFDHGWGLGSLRLVGGSAILCCIIALITYTLVEAPFLRLRQGWSRSSRSGATPS